MAERNYEFRKKLNIVHTPNRRDIHRTAETDEMEIGDGYNIVVSQGASEYLIGIAKDLQDYLFTSMGVSTILARQKSLSQGNILLTTKDESPELGQELSIKRSYRLICKPEEIIICGNDERGTAQGSYYLEDLMNLREAPYIKYSDITRSPLFSPRMVHSGWGIDLFPDQHLNAIAHAGMDAILLFVKDVDTTTTGHLDINDLIERASAYGVDVYLYSYLISNLHPDDPKAEEFYENTYGKLIRSHPGAKGLIFVGESCEFPSKDTRTTGRLSRDPSPDGKPDPRPSPGWWPCTDYPQWLNMLKDIMRRHNPDLDIVFWTYNWGWAPQEDRLALIRNLPTDVSLQATFEMFEDIEKDGIVTRCVDYTASFPGPGLYFSTEAQTAHERGFRLYTMSNTAGLTWDIGVIPYQPIPFQWNRRYKALLKAREDWGLTGLMESHHYGWWPSFVSELAKWAYWEPAISIEEMAEQIAERDFSSEAVPFVIKAWQDWSEAFLNYVPTNEDQYGPFRVGPSYPLFFTGDPERIPSVPFAHFGSNIAITNYVPHEPVDVPVEIELLEKMASQWNDGLKSFSQGLEQVPESKLSKANQMFTLASFILHCIHTTINTKRWWLLKQDLQSETESGRIYEILDKMLVLANEELKNASETIPLVEEDSRLGWEPSMEYMTDRSHIEWKINILQNIVKVEIPEYRKKIHG